MNKTLYNKVKALYDNPGTPGEKAAAKAALDRILAGNEAPPEKEEIQIIHDIYSSSPPITDDEMASYMNFLRPTGASFVNDEKIKWAKVV